MTTFENIWRKLARSKRYREEFALSFLKRSVPFQVKTLRKKHCGSQAVLADRSHLTQGVVSRAEDQDYGNLTFNTVGRIAAGLDMAFIGRFVPFSELVRFSLELSEEEFEKIPTFSEQNEALGLGSVEQGLRTSCLHGNQLVFLGCTLGVSDQQQRKGLGSAIAAIAAGSTKASYATA